MDDECPVCKTTKYRNPSMKLLVNVCGHGLCSSCVETLFARGKQNVGSYHAILVYLGKTDGTKLLGLRLDL